ncbi:MAG: mannosyltransferase family protein [Acidobacteria bacterium]|nr:mannosyltransferase family protein [Acidobacteriota bacterium]
MRAVAEDRINAPVPWWATCLDLLTVALCVVGVMLATSGGLRFRLGPAIVSIRSPWRLFLWAAGVAVLRHLLFRKQPLPVLIWTAIRRAAHSAFQWRPPNPRTLWVRFVGLSRSSAVRGAVFPFVASRGAVLLAGYLAVVAIGYPIDRERPRLASNEAVNVMAKWDAEWYLGIASEGYQWDGTLRHQMRFAFFPGYPMASRAVGWAVGDVATGAALVSLASFFGALVYLFRLAREELGAEQAETALLLLAFSPFAVFYSAIYTESLYLLATVGAFYHFRRSEWAKSSAWGLVAGLTRPNGFLLTAILLTSAALSAFKARRASRALGAAPAPPARLELQPRAWAPPAAGVLAALMPLAGMGAYSAFAYSLTGDPLTWLRLHEMWGRGKTGVWDLLVTHYDWVTQFGLQGYVTSMPIDFINTVAALLALAAVWPVARKLGVVYGVFILVNVAAPLSSGTTLSLARLTSTLFPVFLWLATLIPAKHRSSWIAAFAVLQGFSAVMFYTWRRLY